MAWAESDRVQLRHFLGTGALWLQLYSRVESAITAVQSVADGGQRPDNTTEVYLRTLITDAQSIETRLRELWTRSYVNKAEEVTLDPFRGMVMLRAEGRRVVQSMCRVLSMDGPIADVFSNAKPVLDDNPFSHRGGA